MTLYTPSTEKVPSKRFIPVRQILHVERHIAATGPVLAVALLAHRMTASAAYLLLGSRFVVALGLAAFPALIAMSALMNHGKAVSSRHLPLALFLALLALLLPFPVSLAGPLVLLLDVMLLLCVFVRLRPHGLAGAVPVLLACALISSLVHYTDGIPPTFVVDARLLPPDVRADANALSRPLTPDELDEVAALFAHLTGERVERTPDGFNLPDFSFHVVPAEDYTAVLAAVFGSPPEEMVVHTLEQPAVFFGMDAYLGGSKEQVLRRAMHEYGHIVDTRAFGRTSHAAIVEGYARSLEEVAMHALYEQEKAKAPPANRQTDVVRKAAFERVKKAMMATPAQEVVLNSRPTLRATRHRIQVIEYYITPKNHYSRALFWDDIPEGSPERVRALTEVFLAVFPFSPRSAELPSSFRQEMMLLKQAAESLRDRPVWMSRRAFLEKLIGGHRARIARPLSATILPLFRIPRANYRAAVVLWCTLISVVVLAGVIALDRMAARIEVILMLWTDTSSAFPHVVGDIGPAAFHRST